MSSLVENKSVFANNQTALVGGSLNPLQPIHELFHELFV